MLHSKINDQNGERIYPDIHKVDLADGSHGWARKVWAGGAMNGMATNIRWYVYRTRKAAQNGCISDSKNPNDFVYYNPDLCLYGYPPVIDLN